MSGTMTWVGLDVDARSTHAAVIDLGTGELSRMRFGPGVDAPIAWLRELPAPVRVCYEAGPTGFGLYRAAMESGIEMVVVAPGKTPRGPADRVKTDRKDAELLARCLLAGSLHPVWVPPVEVEAARELTRCHDACRRDLMNARHRVSKMLLRHGRDRSVPGRRRAASGRSDRVGHRPDQPAFGNLEPGKTTGSDDAGLAPWSCAKSCALCRT